MDAEVLVAGSGPVGLTTVALLHGAGTQVRVLERHRVHRARGSAAHPRTLEVPAALPADPTELDGASLVAAVIAVGPPVPTAHLAPPYLAQIRGLSTLQTGLTILPTAAAATVSTPLAGRLLGDGGARRPLVNPPITNAAVSGMPRAQASAERVAARFAEDTHATWPSARRGARP